MGTAPTSSARKTSARNSTAMTITSAEAASASTSRRVHSRPGPPAGYGHRPSHLQTRPALLGRRPRRVTPRGSALGALPSTVVSATSSSASPERPRVRASRLSWVAVPTPMSLPAFPPLFISAIANAPPFVEAVSTPPLPAAVSGPRLPPLPPPVGATTTGAGLPTTGSHAGAPGPPEALARERICPALLASSACRGAGAIRPAGGRLADLAQRRVADRS